MVDELTKDVVHHCLEHHGGVAQSEEHDSWFKQASVSPECGLPFIALLDLHIVEPPAEVKYSEELATTEAGQDIRDEGEGVGVLDHDLIQLPIVLYKAKQTILLLDEEHRGSHRGLGWTDAAICKVLLEEVVKLLLFCRGQGECPGVREFSPVMVQPPFPFSGHLWPPPSLSASALPLLSPLCSNSEACLHNLCNCIMPTLRLTTDQHWTCSDLVPMPRAAIYIPFLHSSYLPDPFSLTIMGNYSLLV